jgi:hypothetical protein
MSGEPILKQDGRRNFRGQRLPREFGRPKFKATLKESHALGVGWGE